MENNLDRETFYIYGPKAFRILNRRHSGIIEFHKKLQEPEIYRMISKEEYDAIPGEEEK